MHHRSALITGASSGIGAAFADTLPLTTDLLLVGRAKDRLAAVAARQTGPERRVETLVADLSTDAGREAVIKRAEEREIDLLINNAGRGKLGAFLDHDPEEERATVELNVTSVLVLTRALLPGMIARAQMSGRKAGMIIVSSQAAFAPVPFFTTYAATKAFDLVFGESLAEELRDDPIDVLTLCPGATRTGFGREAGLDMASIPGAASAKSVARAGLDALGKQDVAFGGRLNHVAFLPFSGPRRLAAAGLGRVMGWASRRATRPSR